MTVLDISLKIKIMISKNVVPIYIVYIQFCKIPECQHKYTPCVEIHNWLLNVKKNKKNY